MIQSVCLPVIRKALGSSPALYRLGVMAHACNPSTEVIEVIQGQPQPHQEKRRPDREDTISREMSGWVGR